MKDYEMIYNLCTSYGYNRDDDYMYKLINHVMDRMMRKNPLQVDDDMREDADILYGFIVVTWGDYGTSPRYGWVDEEHQEGVASELLDFQKTLTYSWKTLKEVKKHETHLQ